MRPEPLPPELTDHPFSLAEGRAAGLTEGRMRRGDVATGVPGVRASRLPPPDGERPWERQRRMTLARARLEMVRMPPDAALCGITAAVVHGLPLRPGRIGSDIHVVAPADDRRRRRRGVTVHPLPRDAGNVVDVDGLRVTDPVTTWCALSAVLSIEELVIVGDALVRREHPRARVHDLKSATTRHGRRWGVKRLRAAAELVRARTDSPRETEVRLILVWQGLPEPELNLDIFDAHGRRIRRGDLIFRRYRVLVEYDGEQHRTDDVQYARDARALERLAAEGWLVIRVRASDMRAPDDIAARVRTALISRGYPAASTVTDGICRLPDENDDRFRP
jgi:hypothetical protein